MTLAYEITGDEKYFQPFRIQREQTDQYRSNPVPIPEPGSQAWVGKVLSEGTRGGHSAADVRSQRIKRFQRQLFWSEKGFCRLCQKYSDGRQLKVAIYNFASQGAERKADTVGLIP